MIVDTSALIAIILEEPGADIFAERLAASQCRLSAVSYFEAGMVLKGPPPVGQSHRLDALLTEIGAEIEPFTHDHARRALAAFQRFGKEFHPARLNFGDCIAYALAVETGEPLLYKGQAFARTDVISALPGP